jgi:hypothetical protein
MELFKTHPFVFDNEKFEVRIYHDDKLLNIVVFNENYPATGIRHQIQIPKATDIQEILKSKKLNYFIELSKKEILENVWENIIS